MKTIIQKAAIILAVVITVGLTAGNPLFAEDQGSIGLIPASDLTFIQAGFKRVESGAVIMSREQTLSLISSTDLAFISQPFSIPSGIHQASAAPETIGMISVADYRFITTGGVPDVFTAYNDLSDSLAGRVAK